MASRYELLYNDSWPLYPFGHGPRKPPPPRRYTLEELRNGDGPAPLIWDGPDQPEPGDVLRLSRDGVTVEWYFPTPDEVATIRAKFPDSDPMQPPWPRIQSMIEPCDWPNVTASMVVARLKAANTEGSPHKQRSTRTKSWTPNASTAKIVKALKNGMSNDNAVERFGKSVKNIRTIRSRAKAHGMLPDK
jgi:hypothetical protein